MILAKLRMTLAEERSVAKEEFSKVRISEQDLQRNNSRRYIRIIQITAIVAFALQVLDFSVYVFSEGWGDFIDWYANTDRLFQLTFLLPYACGLSSVILIYFKKFFVIPWFVLASPVIYFFEYVQEYRDYLYFVKDGTLNGFLEETLGYADSLIFAQAVGFICALLAMLALVGLLRSDFIAVAGVKQIEQRNLRKYLLRK